MSTPHANPDYTNRSKTPNHHEVRNITVTPVEEREALAMSEARVYADDADPSARMVTMDDFLTGWRTADRMRPAQGDYFEGFEEGVTVGRGTPAQTEPTEAQVLAAMTDPNRITDEQADAAQLAHYRFVFGEEGLPNRRELGIYRQAMKVAISEAVRAAQGEPSDTTPEGAEVTFFTQLDSDYAEESATLAQAEHVRREASGLIPPAGRKITKRVTYWVDMPAAFTAGQEEQSRRL